ncbi:MAG: hypothetical protein HY910_06655 [Desulfarculus sp.]|nr:hypothetical protein [Desulfarculus sp.]
MGRMIFGMETNNLYHGGDASPIEAAQAAKQVLDIAIDGMAFSGPIKDVLPTTNDMILDLVLPTPGQGSLDQAQSCLGAPSTRSSPVFGGGGGPLAQRMATVRGNILDKILRDLAANGLDTAQARRQPAQIKQNIGQ